MKTMQRSWHSQRGMTLVELMIAGVIAIIISAVIMQLMIGSNRAANRLTGLAEAQENARFSLSWLSRQVRRGGFNPNINDSPISPVAGLCASNLIPPADNADCSWNGADTDSAGDRIAVRRSFVDDATSNWDQLTCGGENITGIADDEVVVDVYWVAPDADPVNMGDAYDDLLRCATYRESTGTIIGNVQTIASGIESMQILLAEPGVGGSASSYDRADQIADFSNVTVARIGLLSRAFSDTTQQAGTRSYVLLDGEPLIFEDDASTAQVREDWVARQVMETTVFFMNRPLDN